MTLLLMFIFPKNVYFLENIDSTWRDVDRGKKKNKYAACVMYFRALKLAQNI
jgi:hypothetical protein